MISRIKPPLVNISVAVLSILTRKNDKDSLFNLVLLKVICSFSLW